MSAQQLHMAIEEGRDADARRMIEEGLDVNQADEYGQYALHYAAVFGRDGVLQTLIQRGARVNIETANRTTPLHYASRNGQLQCVQPLLQAGADVNCKDRDGWTPLHYACFRGHSNTAQVLINFGALVNEANSHGHTPLHLACNRGYVELACMLITANANLGAQCKSGETPLSLLAITEQPATSPELGVNSLSRSFATLLTEGFLSDAEVEFGDGMRQRVHRCVLAARSIFLKSKLVDGAAPAEETVKHIAIKDLREASGKMFLEWVYTGEVVRLREIKEDIAQMDVVLELLSATSVYLTESEHLRQLCAFYVQRNVSGEILPHVWKIVCERPERYQPIIAQLFTFLVKRSAEVHFPEGTNVASHVSLLPRQKLLDTLRSLKIVHPEPQAAARAVAAPVPSMSPSASRLPAAESMQQPKMEKPSVMQQAPAPTAQQQAASQQRGHDVPEPMEVSSMGPTHRHHHSSPVPQQVPPAVQPQAQQARKSEKPSQGAAAQEKGLSSKDVEYFLETLTQVEKRKTSVWFMAPVDPERDGAPGYRDIIKNPMDLGTIRGRLNSGYYTAVHQVQSDIDLVWANALTYNMPESMVGKAAQLNKQLTDKRGKHVPSIVALKHSDGAPMPSQTAEEEQRERDRKKKKRPHASPSALQPIAPPSSAPMASSMSLAPAPAPPAPAPVALPPQPPAAQPMTIDEMTQLRDMIEKLDESQLAMVVQIVSNSNPSQAASGEVELELSTMEPSVLRELQRYVTATLAGQPYVPSEPSSKRQRFD